jgi:hypothetical protein
VTRLIRKILQGFIASSTAKSFAKRWRKVSGLKIRRHDFLSYGPVG